MYTIKKTCNFVLQNVVAVIIIVTFFISAVVKVDQALYQ